MTDVVTWQAVATLIGVIGVLGTIVWRVWSAISAKNRQLDKKIDGVGKELADYKLHVSENYATQDAINVAFGKVHDELMRLTRRIDDLLKMRGDR